jgi:hypothetical protein
MNLNFWSEEMLGTGGGIAGLAPTVALTTSNV